MQSFELRVDGLEELENDLRKAVDICPKELKKGLDRIANDFRKSARKRTPDYKNHKGSKDKKLIRRYGKWSFAQDDKVGVTIYNDAPHFHLVEYGHQLVKCGELGKGGRVVGFVPGKHMMEQTKNEYEEIVPNQLETILDDVLRGSGLN